MESRAGAYLSVAPEARFNGLTLLAKLDMSATCINISASSLGERLNMQCRFFPLMFSPNFIGFTLFLQVGCIKGIFSFLVSAAASVARLEPSTLGLQGECSTTVLPPRDNLVFRYFFVVITSDNRLPNSDWHYSRTLQRLKCKHHCSPCKVKYSGRH